MSSALAKLRQKIARWISPQPLARTYAGAEANRLTYDWTTGSTTADQEIIASITTLRDRWRQLVRDNAHARRIMQIRVGGIVGTGHVLRAMCTLPDGSPDAEANRLLMRVWQEWRRHPDADGEKNLEGLQTVAARAWQESGDCFVRRRAVRATDGLAVPMQLQVLEGDYLDTSKGTDGIVYDGRGKRIAYWLFTSHPSSGSLESVRVSAKKVCHLYTEDRAGQSRGVPCGAASMRAIKNLDGIEEAAAVKQRVESCITAVVHYDSVEDATLAGWTTDEAGNPTDRIGVGAVLPMPHSKTVSTINPTATSNADALMERQLRAVAMGAGITYEQLTGDLTSVNFSSIRAGRIEVLNEMAILQEQVFQPLFLDRIYEWWVETAVLAGALPERDGGWPAVWQAPQPIEVDRKTAALTDETRLQTGTASFSQIAAEHGRDPRELMAEIAADTKEAAELGVVLSWMQGSP